MLPCQMQGLPSHPPKCLLLDLHNLFTVRISQYKLSSLRLVEFKFASKESSLRFVESSLRFVESSLRFVNSSFYRKNQVFVNACELHRTR